MIYHIIDKEGSRIDLNEEQYLKYINKEEIKSESLTGEKIQTSQKEDKKSKKEKVEELQEDRQDEKTEESEKPEDQLEENSEEK